MASAPRCASTPRAGDGREAPGLVVLGPGDEVELITRAGPRAARGDGRGGTGYVEETTRRRARARHVRPPPRRVGGRRPTSSPFRAATGGSRCTRRSPGRGRRPRRDRDRTRGGPQSATVRLEAHGVTAREREVATLLARGLIATRRSPRRWCCRRTRSGPRQEPVEKPGVTSRQELVARVFLDEYLPEVVRQTPLTSRGRFDRPV